MHEFQQATERQTAINTAEADASSHKLTLDQSMSCAKQNPSKAMQTHTCAHTHTLASKSSKSDLARSTLTGRSGRASPTKTVCVEKRCNQGPRGPLRRMRFSKQRRQMSAHSLRVCPGHASGQQKTLTSKSSCLHGADFASSVACQSSQRCHLAFCTSW